ncbi:MAG: LysR family transcriptional regulator [Clostridiales Family XIII bacterium]|nr:LysR family transcriptional regulator [Clostridiales Family XIII bacterium]
MDIHQLRVFITAAQHLSFTEAAKHLYIAQSAVSHNILELEKELGVRLFDRTKKGLALAPAGEILLVEAFRICSLMEGVSERVRTLSEGGSGELCFGYVSEQMIDPLVPCLRRFCGKHPNIGMQFNTYDSITISRHIEDKKIDLGFGRYENIIRRDEIDWRRLYRDPFRACMGRDHRLAGEKSLSVGALAGEKLILMKRESNPGMFDMVHKLYLSRGLTPMILADTNDQMTTFMMARLGMGIAISSKQFVGGYDMEGLVSIPLTDDDAFHDVGVAWGKNPANPAVGLFLKELDGFLAELPGGEIEV